LLAFDSDGELSEVSGRRLVFDAATMQYASLCSVVARSTFARTESPCSAAPFYFKTSPVSRPKNCWLRRRSRGLSNVAPSRLA
jgi:hypothetical protein